MKKGDKKRLQREREIMNSNEGSRHQQEVGVCQLFTLQEVNNSENDDQ